MKRLLFTFLTFMAISHLSLSQTDQGNLLLGGDVSFSTSESEEEMPNGNTDLTSTTTFSIMPRGGYFVAENFAVGLGIGYTANSIEPNDSTTQRNNSFRVAPFGRYYVSISDHISFFGQAEFGFNSGSSEIEGNGNTIDGPSTTEVDFNVSPGFTIFASDKLGINFQLPSIVRYRSETRENETTGITKTESDFDINFDLNGAGIGVNFFL